MQSIHAKRTASVAMSCRRRPFWLDMHVLHTRSGPGVHTPRAARIGRIRDMAAKVTGKGDADISYGFRSMRASESSSELVSHWKTARNLEPRWARRRSKSPNCFASMEISREPTKNPPTAALRKCRHVSVVRSPTSTIFPVTCCVPECPGPLLPPASL
ncbi:hypothetical protein VTN00DRAFT_3629 [Thermoascus crustaceus]|uniref:uncharacterized protein n=1 Tax=Thermoascus crustaceus TaxID=5088 RepID=UPI00374380E5